MKNKVLAIVPAAGIGSRFVSSVRKTFVPVKGIPLLIHTLKRLDQTEPVSEIITVVRGDDLSQWEEIINNNDLKKVINIISGGAERQDSVYNALKIIEDGHSLVMIHDGVRPVVPHGLVERLIREIDGFEGIVPVTPVKDTIKTVDSNDMVVSTADRNELRAVQTPQLFRLEVIKEAYEKAYAENFYATDDAALVERIGGRVKVIDGSPSNIKVTTPEDLDIVECIMKSGA